MVALTTMAIEAVREAAGSLEDQSATNLNIVDSIFQQVNASSIVTDRAVSIML